MAVCGSSRMLHPVVHRTCRIPLQLLKQELRGNVFSPFEQFQQFCGLVACYCSSVVRFGPRSQAPVAIRTAPRHPKTRVAAHQQLNDEQMLAVQTKEDCVRVVAGPGSGKTLVLTHRIVHLIENRGINPSNVLCITFTNKAKNELRQRLANLLSDATSTKLTIGTFHSVCAKILWESVTKEEDGVSKDFVIYDDQDCVRVLKRIFAEKKEELKQYETIKAISKLKEIELRNFIAKRTHLLKLLAVPPDLKKDLPILHSYQRMLQSYNAVDFDGLIHLTLRMLYRQRDLCEAQYALLRLLCSKYRNLFAVGDVDQVCESYLWVAGADYKNMQDLEHHFPSIATFELRKNYRSSSSILKLASVVIKKAACPNGSLQPLRLRAMKAKGAPVALVQLWPEDEPAYVLERILSLVERKEATFGSFGILYRTRAQSSCFEEVFIANRVPYSISGTRSLLSHKEIKDLQAYLQLICNPDDGVALGRIINTPPRGLGPKSLEKLEKWASNFSLSLPQALQKISREEPSHKELGITSKARNALLELCKLLNDLLRLSEDGPVISLIQIVLERTQFRASLTGSDAHKCQNRVLDFQNLAASMEAEIGSGRSALLKFLEAVSLNENAEQDAKKVDSVKLCTLHAAKGLEFDFVFIIGVNYGTIPLNHADIAEERDSSMWVSLEPEKNWLSALSMNSMNFHSLHFCTYQVSYFQKEQLKLLEINLDRFGDLSDSFY